MNRSNIRNPLWYPCKLQHRYMYIMTYFYSLVSSNGFCTSSLSWCQCLSLMAGFFRSWIRGMIFLKVSIRVFREPHIVQSGLSCAPHNQANIDMHTQLSLTVHITQCTYEVERNLACCWQTLTSLATLFSLLSMPWAWKVMVSVSSDTKVTIFQVSQLDCHSSTSSQITSKCSRSCGKYITL